MHRASHHLIKQRLLGVDLRLEDDVSCSVESHFFQVLSSSLPEACEKGAPRCSPRHMADYDFVCQSHVSLS